MAFRDRNSRPGGGGGGFRSRPSFGDRPRFNDRGSRGPVEMHQAICDNCGKSCEVPFRPTSGKPIYCSNCFESKRGGSESRHSEGGPRFSPHGEDRGPQRHPEPPRHNEQFEALNAKLDKILSILTPLVEEAEEELSEEVEAEEVSAEPAVEKPAKKSKSKKVVEQTPEEEVVS